MRRAGQQKGGCGGQGEGGGANMSVLVRRSNLLGPVTDGDAVAAAWKSGADALTFDLEGTVVSGRKSEARDRVKAAVTMARPGGAEVFVRANKDFLDADLASCVWPGLSGIVLAQAESADEAAQADKLLAALERQRGIPSGTLQIIV